MESLKKSPLAIGVLAIVVVAAIAGIVISNHNSMGGMNMSSANTAGAVATNAVTIKGFAFGPATIKVKAGSSVTWTNQDPVRHTVTVDTGSGPMSQLIAQGESFSYTFTKAGTYTYHCNPHPYMHGTVVVTN